MNRLVARRRKDQRGVSLVLVLVALTIFGLIVPVLGQFGSVNGVSAYIVKGQRYDRYAADSGMNAAIAWAASRRTAGREHVPCPDIVTDVPGPSVTSNRRVVVKCTGFSKSGEPVGSPSVPKYAVLTLSGNDHGVDIASPGNMKTNGPWWVNGPADQTSADIHRVTIDASTDLFGATGGCDPSRSEGGRLYAAPKWCKRGDLPRLDPDYGSSLPPIADLQADPPVDRGNYCNSDGGVVTLNPGIHWDAVWLNKLTDGTCGADVVIWLEPGAHYFDFDFYNPGSDSEWVIGGGRNNVTVVGGTLPGGTQVPPTQDNGATGPRACDLGSPGVELVLGSKSHITIQSPAHVELCPLQPSGDTLSQHIAISGPKVGAAGKPTSVESATPISAVPDGARDSFTWPAALPAPIPPAPPALATQDCRRNQTCDPQLYVEGRLRRGRDTATVTMQVPNHFAKNAKVDTLTLDVSHREVESDDGEGDGNGRDRLRDLTFEITGIPGTRVVCDPIPGASSDWTVTTVQCRLATPVPMPDPNAVRNLGVVMRIRTNNGDHGSVTVALDHLAIDGMQIGAAVRAQQCDCDALFFDNGGGAGSAFVWGTVYLPTADVKADFGGGTAFKLARGLVTRSLALTNLANDRSFIPIELPGGGIYSTRTVAFEARIGTATEPTLKSRVEFDDPTTSPGAPPVFPPPTITSWNPHK